MITFRQFLEGIAVPNTEEFANFEILAEKLLEADPSRRLLIKFALYCAQSVLRYNNETTLPLSEECIRLLQNYLEVMDTGDEERLDQLRISLNAARADAVRAAADAARAAADAAANAAWASADAADAAWDAANDAARAAAVRAASDAADAAWIAAVRAASDADVLRDRLMNYGRQLLTTIKDKSTIRTDLQQTIQEFISKNPRELTKDDIQTAIIIANNEGLIDNLVDHMSKHIGNIKDIHHLIDMVYVSIGNRMLLQSLLRKAL